VDLPDPDSPVNQKTLEGWLLRLSRRQRVIFPLYGTVWGDFIFRGFLEKGYQNSCGAWFREADRKNRAIMGP
jgi:hypothetical protein